MMGHSGTVPGAILAEDVPAALDRLKRAIETEQALPIPDSSKGQPGQRLESGACKA